ncbi:MAG: virulence RhuM family protein [Bacteroidales bacterium]|nr:virulence RhuM family protein [Bacteroidales bacterium]
MLSYNLDMIISVGYRVKSKQGIQFRRWATRIFKRISFKRFCYWPPDRTDRKTCHRNWAACN